MEIIRNIWNKIKQPKGWQLALFYVVFIILVSLTLFLVITQQEQTILHYVLYFFSFILLSYFVYTMFLIVPKITKGIITWLEKYKFTNTLLKNYGYRTIVFSVFSFIFNSAYMAFLIVIAVLNHSYWYFAVGIYYLVLCLTKGYIFLQKYKYKTKSKQIETFRRCGVMFILLTQALIGISTLIFFTKYQINYTGLSIYVVATYTFYRLTLAIYNFFKAKRQNDLYIEAFRNINLASALVSLFVLQVALIQAFSPNNSETIFNALTGACVSIIILSIGIYMIKKANIFIKNRNNKTKDLLIKKQQKNEAGENTYEKI